MEIGRDRPLGQGRWNVWRGIVAGFYLASAVFNGVFTLPRADDGEVFDGYADGAWFSFLEDFMRDVFAPNGVVFMAVVIVFEVIVGVLILGRAERVDLGVVASLLWVVAILPFLAWPYLLVNVVLFMAQGALLLRRFDTELWPFGPRSRRGAPHAS